MSRPVRLLALLVAIGCEHPAPPSPATAAPMFDPRLRLRWPAPPVEGTGTTPTEVGELKTYNASHIDKRPDGSLGFAAFVTEYPPDPNGWATPDRLLSAYTASYLQGVEAQTPVRFGPGEHPGLDIRRRRNGKPDRTLVVVAGRRVYHLTASATSDELLRDPAVEAFFASFAVAE